MAEVDGPNSSTGQEGEIYADTGAGRKWRVVPLKVAYLIYVLPTMMLVGVIFLLNARYDIAPTSTVLCITFPLILSILLISIMSIIQYRRGARN
jgi:hypothetical protein